MISPHTYKKTVINKIRSLTYSHILIWWHADTTEEYIMNENEIYPRIPKGAKCKNSKYSKLITETLGYVHLYRPGTTTNTGNHEFFCCMQCHTAHKEHEQSIVATDKLSNIVYLEHG